MTKIIEAIQMCNSDKEQIIKKVKELEHKKTSHLELMIINASDNEANERYIKGKVADCEAVGIKATVKHFEKDCLTSDVLGTIIDCNNKNIPIILQLPIYPHLDEEFLIHCIDVNVDADGFNNWWLGEVLKGTQNTVAPATPKGVMDILDFEGVSLEGKVALVVGKSKHVGKPLSLMLMERGATVITANSKTKDLGSLVRISDIVISCVGVPELIKPSDVKEGAVLIGVGFSYVNGKQVLDFDIDKIVEDGKASIVSNRLRCTGKATINALIKNIVELYDIHLR